MNQTNSLPPEAIGALVGGFHGAPFDILGPRLTEEGVVIRAFLPQATAVNIQLVSKKKTADSRPMSQIARLPAGAHLSQW
jgi:hypothetical protein